MASGDAATLTEPHDRRPPSSPAATNVGMTHPKRRASVTTDAQWDAPEAYSYEYKSSVTGQFQSYDPGEPAL